MIRYLMKKGHATRRPAMPQRGWLIVFSPEGVLTGSRCNRAAALFLGALFAGSALLLARG